VGLFYRDIYWKFPQFETGLSRLKLSAARYFYRADLRAYLNSVDTLFLPSRRMAKYLPEENQSQVAPSPPGATLRAPAKRMSSKPLSLLYVGGIGYGYQLHKCVSAVTLVPDTHLIICTREAEWSEHQNSYNIESNVRVEVVHKSAHSLDDLYASADICVLFLKVDEYRDFAAPVKLYEYLGAGKPVIVSEGCLAAEIIKQTGAGWVVEYDELALSNLLIYLSNNPQEVHAKSQIAISLGKKQTWVSRARIIANHLMGVQPLLLGPEKDKEKQIKELIGEFQFENL
jgi:glycosyltransferase involved in cell wall biosynthesis